MPIHTETRGAVGVITLDRPDKAHAYDRAHLDELAQGFARLAAQVRVVVVRSTGAGAFCAGADLDELGRAAPEDALDLYSQAVFSQIARSPVLSVAAVHGAAIAGGFELALACDLRVVGPHARCALPETGFGLIPSAGGTTRLTRLVGPSVAKQVILLGDELDARDCVRLGLAVGVADDPFAEALALAERIAARDPVALRLAKQIIDRAEDGSSLDAERVAEAVLYGRRGG